MASEKKGNEFQKPLHIAMYPWFAFGHFNGFLRLANKLAEKGQQISFFVPSKTQPKLCPHNHHPTLITFIPITIPHVDGLPIGAETTNDIPTSAQPLLMTAMDLTQPVIDSHLARLKPDVIFFDFAQWIPGLARNHGAKSVKYSAGYLVSTAYWMSRAEPSGFPCPAIRLRAHEARDAVCSVKMDFGGGIGLAERHKIGGEGCDAVGFKACREMEGAYFDIVSKKFGKPVLLVGPMLPESPVATKLYDRFDDWFKGFDNATVIYCALGSECFLRKHQFQELLLGLELTGMPFLAALKPPTGCETIELASPEGFLERTKGRGLIHDGWVQQQLILQHPSVGCFVTHCGANSLSEALLSKCQLVFLPQQGEQILNARMMSLDLKVGLEIDKGEEVEFFTKEAVCEAIMTVMKAESEVGREVRANHIKWRQLLLTKGLEESYMSELINSLRNLLE